MFVVVVIITVSSSCCDQFFLSFFLSFKEKERTNEKVVGKSVLLLEGCREELAMGFVQKLMDSLQPQNNERKRGQCLVIDEEKKKKRRTQRARGERDWSFLRVAAAQEPSSAARAVKISETEALSSKQRLMVPMFG